MIIRPNRIDAAWQKAATALEKKFGCIYVLGCDEKSMSFAVRKGEGGSEFVNKPNTDNAPEGIKLVAFEGIVTATFEAKKEAPKTAPAKPAEDVPAKPKKAKSESFSASKTEQKKRKEL